MEDLLNDNNVGILQRMTLISGSNSLAGAVAHEEILKKIKVNGVSLSLIRKERQNLFSLKKSSKETPLLQNKNSSFSKEMSLHSKQMVELSLSPKKNQNL